MRLVTLPMRGLYVLAGFGGTMGKRSRPDSRLVGKGRPLDSGGNDCRDCNARRSTHGSRTGEGIVKDPEEQNRDLRQMRCQYIKTSQYVESTHQGHDAARDSSDALNPTDNHPADDQHTDDSGPTSAQSIGALQNLCHLIGLKERQATHQAANGKQNRQNPKASTKTGLDKVHWSALIHVVFVLQAVHTGKGTGEESGGHAHGCRDPHPEHGPRSALGDGHRHSGNIPHTDG